MRMYSHICTSIRTHTQVSICMYEEWLVGWLDGWLAGYSFACQKVVYVVKETDLNSRRTKNTPTSIKIQQKNKNDRQCRITIFINVVSFYSY